MPIRRLRTAYLSSAVACVALIPIRFVSEEVAVEVIQATLFVIAVACSGMYLSLTRKTHGAQRGSAWLVLLAGMGYALLALGIAVLYSTYMRDFN